MRMTIGKKLGLGFGAVLVLMLVLGVVSYWGFEGLHKKSGEAIEKLNLDMVLDERIGDHLKLEYSLRLAAGSLL